MAIREYLFDNLNFNDRIFSISEEIKHQSLCQVEISFDDGNNYNIIDINKYEIIESIIILNDIDYFKKKKNILIKVADLSSELDLVAIPFTTDIKEDNEEITENEEFISQSLIDDNNLKTSITNLEDEIEIEQTTITDNENTIESNENVIENNVVNIEDSIETYNNIIDIYKQIKLGKITTEENFNDDYSIDTEYYDNLKDEAIIDKDEAETYASEADVSNNLDISRLTTAKSSINSSLNNIKEYTKNIRTQEINAIDYKYKTLHYLNTAKNYYNTTEEFKKLSLEAKNDAESAENEIEIIKDQIEENSISNIIDDSSVLVDKTFSSYKTEEVLDNSLDLTKIKNSNYLENLKTYGEFYNLTDIDEVTEDDEFKIYKDGNYKRIKISDLKNKIIDKDFNNFYETYNITSEDKLLVYNGSYLKTSKLNNKKYGFDTQVGLDENSVPIIRKYFKLDYTNINTINFEIDKNDYDIGNIYSIKSNINNTLNFKKSYAFVEDNIIKIPSDGYSNCNVIIDCNIIDIVDDNPLIYDGTFNESNSVITNATYYNGNIYNVLNTDSSINIVEYEQETEDGPFKSYRSETTLLMNNLDIFEATNTQFKTKKLIKEGDSIYINNIDGEKLINIGEITEETTEGDLSYTLDETESGIYPSSVRCFKNVDNDYLVETVFSSSLITFRKLNKDNKLTELNTNTIAPSYFTGGTTFAINGDHILNTNVEKYNGCIYVLVHISNLNRIALIKYNPSDNSITATINNIYYNYAPSFLSIIDGYIFTIAGYNNAYLLKLDFNLNVINTSTYEYKSTTSLPVVVKLHKTKEGYYLMLNKTYTNNGNRLIDSSSLNPIKSIFQNSYCRFNYDENIIFAIENNGDIIKVDSANYDTFGTNLFNYNNSLLNSTISAGIDTWLYLGEFSGYKYWLIKGIYNGYYNYLKLEVSTGTYSILNNTEFSTTSSGYAYVLAYYYEDDGKLRIFDSSTTSYVLDFRPYEAGYIVDISSENLSTAPTVVWQKPEIVFKSGVSDTTGITTSDLSIKSEVSRTITGDFITIETEETEESTNTKRFYMWQIIAKNFNYLKKVITYLTKKES